MDFSAVVTSEQLPTLSFAIATLIGLVRMVKLQFPRVVGIYSLILTVTFGLIAGSLNLFGITPALGLLAGFASSGVYTLAQKAGGL